MLVVKVKLRALAAAYVPMARNVVDESESESVKLSQREVVHSLDGVGAAVIEDLPGELSMSFIYGRKTKNWFSPSQRSAACWSII